MLTKELQLLLMNFNNPETGWFEFAEVPIIDQYLARISQTFNKVWLSRYPRPCKFISDNEYEFKKNLIPLLKDFAVKSTCDTIKNAQENYTSKRIHKVIDRMINNKEIS